MLVSFFYKPNLLKNIHFNKNNFFNHCLMFEYFAFLGTAGIYLRLHRKLSRVWKQSIANIFPFFFTFNLCFSPVYQIMNT